MNLIEQLTSGMEAGPDEIDQVIRGALRSDFDLEATFSEYQTAEYALGSLFKVLTSKRTVTQSTFNTFKAQHVQQYDMYKPITLSGATAQIVCYPMRVYDEAGSIDGKGDELKAKTVRPVMGYTKTSQGYPVQEKWYGYLFAPAPLDIFRGEDNLPLALEDIKSDFTTLTRSNPGNWLTSFRVDRGMREDQDRFKQLTEELLVHEGHQQALTWQ